MLSEERRNRTEEREQYEYARQMEKEYVKRIRLLLLYNWMCTQARHALSRRLRLACGDTADISYGSGSGKSDT